jgi:flagellar hook-length control protein FliK
MQPSATPEAVNPAGSASSATGTNITGMQPLATPEVIDPAALTPGTNTAAGSAVGAAAPALGNVPNALTSSTQRDSTQPGANSANSANTTGMQPLATREATNPAAVPPGANPAAGRAVGSAAPALGDARDARTSSTRRDTKTNTNTATDTTVALRAPAPTWQPLTNASARGTTAAGGSETLRGRSATWANSTVSMDLSAAREVDSVAGNAVSLTARLSAMLAGQAQADVAAPTPLLGATQDAGTHPAEAPSPADLLTSREAAPEPEPAQLSHWSTQHLRHAHLRLGEGALDSVDIRLSMQGQDLSVDFRTDNADIRQSLAQQANQSLATLLERSGIALADVSVGAQQQQRQPQGQGSEPQRGGGLAQVGRGPAGRAEAESVAVRAPAAQPLRADGSRPLDLFV